MSCTKSGCQWHSNEWTNARDATHVTAATKCNRNKNRPRVQVKNAIINSHLIVNCRHIHIVLFFVWFRLLFSYIKIFFWQHYYRRSSRSALDWSFFVVFEYELVFCLHTIIMSVCKHAANKIKENNNHIYPSIYLYKLMTDKKVTIKKK